MGLLAIVAIAWVAIESRSRSSPDRPPASATAAGTPSATGSPAGPSAAEDGSQQASALDDLLDDSADSRQQVVDAVNDIAACTSNSSLEDAENALTSAAGQRDDQVSQLDGLDMGSVDGGAEAVAALQSAWQHSADADRAFAQWAADSMGCTPDDVPHGTDFHSGTQASELATEDKDEFVRLWTPIADYYGLPERTAGQL